LCGPAAVIIAGLVSVLAHPGNARAFSAPAIFAKDAVLGGTEGRFFTGSPADGYGCEVCHSGGPSLPIYVTGLPTKGYVTGMTYDVRLWWPEFTARERQLQAGNPVDPPTMSVNAEFVSETGKGSGLVVIKDPVNYTPNERCVYPEGKVGQSLWVVKPKSKPLGEILLECTSEEYNDRCLVSLVSCGASELRMKWTAPPSLQGTIWFNAAIVTTDVSDSQPTHDGTYELSVPLPAPLSTSAGYIEKLDGSCAVAAPGTSGPARFTIVGLWLFVAARARGRVRRARPARSEECS
jgi:hypothetical protein